MLRSSLRANNNHITRNMSTLLLSNKTIHFSSSNAQSKLYLNKASSASYTTIANKAPVTYGLYKYQDSLPSLPVPELKKTLEVYKKSVATFYPKGLDDVNFKKYCKVIDHFADQDEGSVLQSRLVDFAKSKRNWLSEYWDNYAYLDYRDPVSPFVSYFFSHKNINSPIGQDQLLKAAALTYQTLKFANSVELQTLEPEVIKGNSFCMESFKWMFNTSRIPNPKRDEAKVFDSTESRFIIVISNDRFYKLYHHDSATDEILSPALILDQLTKIKLDSISKPKVKNPIGLLTSANRDVWAEAYIELSKISTINEASLNDIQSSTFVVCLDNDIYPVTIEAQSRNCWHGDGKNRFFDKPIQLIVAANGRSGFLGEHSKMDGTPNLRLNDTLVSEISKMSLKDFESDTSSSSSKVAGVEELQFEINPKIQDTIAKELTTFENTVNSLDIAVFQHFGIGKNQIKKFKVSPDAFIQMAMQLAYYKMTGVLRPTYESASTRKYFKGRTETCRSASLEALDFVKTWHDPNATNKEKAQAFKTAVSQHVNYISKASDGYGVDRHLFGLLQMYKPEDSKHEIFTDPMFKYSQYWYLSTSQLSSNNFDGYGWSPVVPEGLGLAYMINDNWSHVNITAFKDNQFGLKVDEMRYYLNLSFNELNEVLNLDLAELATKSKL